MDLDELIRAVVPLTFLAIWALTSLFNREAKPLPPRGGFGNPLGQGPPPRPIPPSVGGQRPMANPLTGREPTMRWGGEPQDPGPSYGEFGANRPFEFPARQDEPLIIGEGGQGRRQAGSPATPLILPQKSKAQRKREARLERPKPNRPESPQDLVRTSSIQHGVSQNLNQSIVVGSLTQGDPNETASVANRGASFGIASRLLDSPEKLRAALILREILDLPISLRRRAGHK